MKYLLATAAVLVSTTSAIAHEGARVWIGNTAGKIATLASDNDLDPATYRASLAFGTQFNNFFDIYTTEFPGFEVRRDGGGVSEETRFGFNILSPLLRFDPVTQDFRWAPSAITAVPGPRPTPWPSLLITQGQRERRSSSGFVAGFDFFDFFGVGDHSHLAFTYLGYGDGIGQAANGIYSIRLELTSPSLQTSDPFFLVFGKGVPTSDPDFVRALQAAESVVVPEPSALPLVFASLAVALGRKARATHQ